MDVDIGVVEGGVHGTPLEGRRIARDGRELLLPEPPQRIFRRFQSHEMRVRLDEEVLELVGRELVVGFREADSDEQDVAGPELDLALFHDVLEVLQLYGGRTERVRVNPVLGCPVCPVEQDTAADDTTVVDPD